jgi:hypothetical protein
MPTPPLSWMTQSSGVITTQATVSGTESCFGQGCSLDYLLAVDIRRNKPVRRLPVLNRGIIPHASARKTRPLTPLFDSRFLGSSRAKNRLTRGRIGVRVHIMSRSPSPPPVGERRSLSLFSLPSLPRASINRYGRSCA